jgi:hypothetical protein
MRAAAFIPLLQAEAPLGALELVEHRRHNPAAGRPERMSQGDRAAFRRGLLRRAAFERLSAIWFTDPTMTSSTTAGSIPVRSIKASMVLASKSTVCQADRPLPHLPIAVRTTSTITASVTAMPFSMTR